MTSLAFLPVFGDEFGNPPEPCDYDGTPLEDVDGGITNGDIILIQFSIEYELEHVLNIRRLSRSRHRHIIFTIMLC